MRRLLVTALCLLALPALAADEAPLQGQWQVRLPSDPKYVGVVLIDDMGRATWDSPADTGRPARFVGYIAHRDEQRVEIVFTDKRNVARTNCARQSPTALYCYNLRQGMPPTEGFMLVKIGPGPASLMPAPR